MPPAGEPVVLQGSSSARSPSTHSKPPAWPQDVQTEQRVRVPTMTAEERSFQAAARALQARLTRGIMAEMEQEQTSLGNRFSPCASAVWHRALA